MDRHRCPVLPILIARAMKLYAICRLRVKLLNLEEQGRSWCQTMLLVLGLLQKKPQVVIRRSLLSLVI
jgi:hypothetical protein